MIASRLAIAGQCALIVLGIAWALLERPAPVINVQWRDEVGAAERQRLERQFMLERGEQSGGTWRYDLAQPDRSTIEAIVTSPAVRDTHHVNRSTYDLDADVAYSRSHTWWAGPFRGERGRAYFRYTVLAIGCLTTLCAWLARR